MPQGKRGRQRKDARYGLGRRCAVAAPLLGCLLSALNSCSVGVMFLDDPISESLSEPSSESFERSDQDMPTPVKATDVVAQGVLMAHFTYDLPEATVHVVKINPQLASFSVVVADELETVDAIARQENAVTAINAGFFDPQNGKTTSYLFADRQLVGDPADNERLIGNPDLQQYLPSILNRSEFRHYRCSQLVGEVDSYAIARHTDPVPESCQLENAIGGGPQLLPTDTSAAEAFTDTENGELIRDAIGSTQPNARSAIGIIESTEEIVLIMAAQREDAAGFTLSDMTDFAETLGVTALLNLDGGSSSTLHYSGDTYTARRGADGNPIERPVKSVIIFK